MATQTYYPVANSVGPQSVRETDDAYVIEDVPFIRPMELAGGYVPEQSVRETAGAWEGVPATLNHPRDDSGRPVAANEQPETHIGVTENPTYDGTHVRGDIRLSKDRLDALGGEAGDVERALREGTTVDVSSQYAAAELPSGEYDGEVRDNAEAIARPDSVAILPNTTGVCSIEDGCGINPQMAANAAVTVPMTANGNKPDDMSASADAEFSEGDLVRWSTSQGSPGTGRVDAVVTEPGATVSAEGADVTREATEDEAAYRLDNWTGDEYDSGVVVKSASEIIGKWSDAPDAAMTANMEVPAEYRHDNPGEAVEQAQEMGFDGAGDEIIHSHDDGDETVFMPAPSHEELVATLREMGELPGDTESNRMHGNAVRSALRTLSNALSVSTPAADDDVSPERGRSEDAGESSRGERTDELIDEYGFSAANLPDESTRCFDKIYANVTADGADAAATDDESMSDDTIELDDLSDDAHEALVDEAVERIEANRAEDKKDDLVTEIIANSADHDSDDRDTLLDTPVDVLETLAANVSDSTAGVPAMGQTANATMPDGDDTLEEYPDGTIGGDL